MRDGSDPSEAIFKTRGLTKVYVSGEVEVRALAGLDLEIWNGEMVVLLGPSGSGKSTLLNIMGGLDHATSGPPVRALCRPLLGAQARQHR